MSAGTVPSGWHRMRIADIATVSRGASPRPIASPRWFSEKSDIGWVRIADLARSDGLALKSTTQRLSPAGIARSRLLPPGTLIMSIAATVGRPIITAIPACIHDGFVAFEDLKGVDQTYLLYSLKALEGELETIGQTGSQANVNTDIVKSLTIPVPPVAEQRAITCALRDADRNVAAFARLIAKKQAIKHGMMQQLLTGKSRFLDFTDSWREATVGELSEQHRRLVDPRQTPAREFEHFSVPAYDDGKTPVVETGSMIGSVKFVVPPGAVLVSKLNPRIPRIWAPPQIGANAIASTEFVVLTVKSGTYRSFLRWLLNSTQVVNRMKLLATGTTGSHVRIHPRQISFIEVTLPSKGEQTAIAKVLDDVNREISLLTGRLTKAKAIKQGMMQELLTGRTRLPIHGAAV